MKQNFITYTVREYNDKLIRTTKVSKNSPFLSIYESWLPVMDEVYNQIIFTDTGDPKLWESFERDMANAIQDETA